MTYKLVSVACGGRGFDSPLKERVFYYDNRENRTTPCRAYGYLLMCCKSEVIIYAHDDVSIGDSNWAAPVISLFDNPKCVAVGLGGATALGNRDLYRTPFNIWNMARSGYASNQTDAETHGERFTGVRRVAVLDAFFMAVRADWLRSIGGWPVDHLTHHCLDLWLACEAARDEKEIWQVGVSCTHWGGGTSTKPEYAKAKWLQGGSLEEDHIAPHRWLYNEYRDVLPITV